MRLVVTSDTHHPVGLKFIPNGDIFIHAGDLMNTGYPEDFHKCIQWLAELPHKTKIFVPGNHDFHMMNYPGPALQELRRIGVTVIGLPGNTNFATYKLENGMSILGLPFVTGLDRWAFNTTEQKIWKYIDGMGRHDIIISHAPAYGILDKLNITKESVGIKAYRNYLTKYKPAIWCHGHIHEAYGAHIAEKCKFFNVAMCDRKHRHVNPPIVIDL